MRVRAKLRCRTAAAIYLLALLWELIKAFEAHLFHFYGVFLRGQWSLLELYPYTIVPPVATLALLALVAMAWRGRVRLVCTAVYAARLLLPFLWVRLQPAYAEDLFVAPAVACLLLVCSASFVLLRKARLVEGPGVGEGGYYEDLYRQGVISREEYEEMTRDR